MLLDQFQIHMASQFEEKKKQKDVKAVLNTYVYSLDLIKFVHFNIHKYKYFY